MRLRRKKEAPSRRRVGPGVFSLGGETLETCWPFHRVEKVLNVRIVGEESGKQTQRDQKAIHSSNGAPKGQKTGAHRMGSSQLIIEKGQRMTYRGEPSCCLQGCILDSEK